mgnify:CR=1 FL=1
MKRTYKLLAITILALLGSFALPLTECEEVKQEEKLYFEVSIGVIAGDTVFSKNIRFIFKNLEEGGLPFNRNLEAFSEGFKSLRVELIPEGSRFVLFFDIFYDSSVGHSKAISYANEAIHHILDNIFEYNIQELGNHTETKGSKIEVKSTYGYGETSLQEISKFIKYKPLRHRIRDALQEYCGEYHENIEFYRNLELTLRLLYDGDVARDVDNLWKDKNNAQEDYIRLFKSN